MSLLLALLGASVVVGPTPAGHGTRLADYEQQWSQQEQVEPAPVVRPKAKRRAEVHTLNALPEVARVYVDRLKAERDEARTDEIRALMALGSEATAIRVEVTRAAAEFARRKQEAAAQALEEFDVMYVAAILAVS